MTEYHIDKLYESLKAFLQGMNNKYGGRDLLRFHATKHLIERTYKDRSEQLPEKILSTMLSKIFQNKLCELIFCAKVSILEDKDLRVRYSDYTLGIKAKENDRGFLQLNLSTLFIGKRESTFRDYIYLTIED